MSDWPGDVTPLPHAATEDRLQARLTAMVAAHCSTPDCPGDYRYPPPGRGHVPGCTYPFAPDEETRPMSEHTPEVAEDEQECGYVYDHDTETVFEDAEMIQWICRKCGAEGWEDLTAGSDR